MTVQDRLPTEDRQPSISRLRGSTHSAANSLARILGYLDLAIQSNHDDAVGSLLQEVQAGAEAMNEDIQSLVAELGVPTE